MYFSLPFILSPMTIGRTPSPEDNLPAEPTDNGQATQNQKQTEQTSQQEGALTDKVALTKDEYAQLVNLANLAKLGQSIQSERDQLRETKARLETQLEMYKTQVEQKATTQHPTKTPVDEFLERRLRRKEPEQSDSFFEEETPQLNQDFLIKYGEALLETADKRTQQRLDERMQDVSKTLSKTKEEIQTEQQQRDRIKDTKTAIEKQMDKLTSELAVKYNAPANLVSEYRQLLELRAVKWKEFEDAEDKAKVIYDLAQLEDAIEIKKDEMKVAKTKKDSEVKTKASLPETSVIPTERPTPSELRPGETVRERNLRDAIEAYKRSQKYGP